MDVVPDDAAMASLRADRPLVAVVVLAWNGWEDTRACLASLRRVTHAPVRVVLVDNGSTDGTPTLARAAFPEVDVLENGANLGFCVANNRGVARSLDAGTDYVMLLNNDTVVEPEFLEPLLDAFEREPRLGFASPEIVYADDPARVWFAGGKIDWRTGWATHAQADALAGGSPADTPFATGCCLIARAGVWREVGLLDERFFLLWEDTDWSVRATRAGWHGAVVRASRVRHKVSASFERGARGLGAFYFTRNGLLFIRKHAPRPAPTALRFLGLWLLGPSLREARRRERGWWRLALLRLGGLVAFATGSFGAAPGYARRLTGSSSQ